jgi:hypothetical protein
MITLCGSCGKVEQFCTCLLPLPTPPPPPPIGEISPELRRVLIVLAAIVKLSNSY